MTMVGIQPKEADKEANRAAAAHPHADTTQKRPTPKGSEGELGTHEIQASKLHKKRKRKKKEERFRLLTYDQR